MKLSVSLPEEDVRFLDEYSARADSSTRSSAIHAAIGLLRQSTLADSYAAAFEEWDADEAATWEPTAADGMVDSRP